MSESRRILFAGRSVYHFPYYESVFESLIASGATVVFVYDKDSSKGQSATALQNFLVKHGDSCELRFAPRAVGWSARVLRVTRELRAYGHYLRRMSGSQFYVTRQANYLPSPLRHIASTRRLRFLFSSTALYKLLEMLEALLPVDSLVRNLVCEIQPSAIFAAPINMRFSREVDFIKMGNRAGIPTFGLVQTWDNLTTKGIFHCRPGHLFCWNEHHKTEAVQIHNFSPHEISVVGAPFYDKWFTDTSPKCSRSEALQHLGLQPNDQYILYLGSSANIAKDESWLVKLLAVAINEIPGSRLHVVVRPHPVNVSWISKLQSTDHRVVVDPSSSLPEDRASIRQLAATIQHAEFAIGVNTSAMIDSVILGTTCVALICDRYSLTQSEALHFGVLRNTGALPEYRSTELKQMISELSARTLSSKAEATLRVLPLVRPKMLSSSAGQLVSDGILSRSIKSL